MLRLIMLDVRTNILLDKETHQLLSSIAKSENTSMGELIRKAIEKEYKKNEDEIIRKRMFAYKAILRLRKKFKPLGKITYRQLIEYGRYR